MRFKTTGSDSRTYEFRGGDSQRTPSVKNGSYLCGEWIELKSVIDTAAKTFDVYANGELLGENIAMSCKTESAVMDSLDNISFLTGSKDMTHAYIDDLRVSLKTTDSGEGDGDGDGEGGILPRTKRRASWTASTSWPMAGSCSCRWKATPSPARCWKNPPGTGGRLHQRVFLCDY